MLRLVLILGLLIVLFSFWQAYGSHDVHWAQRGGALLAALAAFLAVFEAFVENRVRQAEVSKPENRDDRGIERSFLAISDRIRQARFRATHTALSHDKFRTVFFISMIAVIGEILHGFGDLIFVFLIHTIDPSWTGH